MTRKKVKLAFIADDIARKISYKKRKKGILKKMEELTTLCGIEACAIIYSEFDSQQPEIWPSPWGVHRVLTKFKRYPHAEQCKKMLNQETYMGQRVNKAKEQLEKVMKDNRQKEMSLLMYQYLTEGKILDNLSVVDLNDLAWLIGQKQEEIDDRMIALNKSMASTSQAQPPKREVVEVAQVVANVGATKQGEDRGKGVVEMNNMDVATQDMPWYLDLINGGEDGNQMMWPIGDFNYLYK